MGRKAQDNYFLGLVLAEYLRQLEAGIASAYAALPDKQEHKEAIRVWRPFPAGPLCPLEFPTESDPATAWEWETPRARVPALGELEEVMKRFRGFVDAMQGGDDGG